jgi:hypothetical protein
MSEYDDYENYRLLDKYVGMRLVASSFVDKEERKKIHDELIRRMSPQQPEAQPGSFDIEEYYKEDEFDYIVTIADANVKYEYKLHGSGEYSIQELIDILVSRTKLREISCERVIYQPPQQPEAPKEAELLPCPFCGNKPEFVEDYLTDNSPAKSLFVRCVGKDCTVAPEAMNEDKQSVAKDWNTRVPRKSVAETQPEWIELTNKEEYSKNGDVYLCGDEPIFVNENKPHMRTVGELIAGSDATRAFRFVPRKKCPKCGQVDIGQTGEYPCSECGLPTTWDGIPQSAADRKLEIATKALRNVIEIYGHTHDAHWNDDVVHCPACISQTALAEIAAVDKE